MSLQYNYGTAYYSTRSLVLDSSASESYCTSTYSDKTDYYYATYNFLLSSGEYNTYLYKVLTLTRYAYKTLLSIDYTTSYINLAGND
jgi:hypothetical protein